MRTQNEISRNPDTGFKSTIARRLQITGALGLLVLATSATLAKKPVNTADDLPRHTYDIKANALQILKDKPAILALAQQLKADAEADLDAYDIKDRSILSAYQQMLQQIDMLNGRYDSALARIPTLRDLEPREADKLLTGLSLTAHVAALKAATSQDGGLDQARYDNTFKTELRAEISKLPMNVIHDALQQRRSALKMVSRDLLLAGVDQQLNPVITANPGKVPGEVAASLISTKFLLDTGLHWATLAGDVYGEFLDGSPVAATLTAPEKKDVWTPTLVSLDKAASATPVVVAIWDTGFDTSLFPGQLWTNNNPSRDGSDLHGIAFDMDHHRTTGDLYPLNALKTDKATCMSYLAAGMEMQAGMETPGVLALQNHVLSLKGQAVQDFEQDMGIIGNYAHGTHVAGIVAAGNPFVRLLMIRETFDFKSIPDRAPTLDEYERWGESAQSAIQFARAAHARVVNMSWRIPRAAVEAQLNSKGVGKSTAERAELSRQIFNAFKDRLEKAIAGAPDILFVAGAGNEDNDADFSEYVPAGLRLPNLLTVSAVDAYGRPTTFTTTGKNIDLYADGYEIDSVVPGGQHMKFSGTSMASPQVANLAAKLIALHPQLTVAQTVQIIRKGATPLQDHQGKFIINPAVSVAISSAMLSRLH